MLDHAPRFQLANLSRGASVCALPTILPMMNDESDVVSEDVVGPD